MGRNVVDGDVSSAFGLSDEVALAREVPVAAFVKAESVVGDRAGADELGGGRSLLKAKWMEIGAVGSV